MDFSFFIQHPETSIQYLSSLKDKFKQSNYRQDLVDVALISAYA